VGHRVKIHKIKPGKEQGDLEIKDCVILQKPQEQTDRLPPPRTLILDFTMTHVHSMDDGMCILSDSCQTQEPNVFMPVVVDTSGRIYDDFLRLLFLHDHREASTLTNEIPGQFRFLRPGCLGNIKGSLELILVKAPVMRISIPLDLSSRTFIPLHRFNRSRRPTPLLGFPRLFSSVFFLNDT
jgi:hypothetical protein